LDQTKQQFYTTYYRHITANSAGRTSVWRDINAICAELCLEQNHHRSNSPRVEPQLKSTDVYNFYVKFHKQAPHGTAATDRLLIRG